LKAPNESRDIERLQGAKIILAGSGMSVGGRVLSHEEDFLPDPKNTILLVGYQTTGSLGRQLADGAKKVTIHGREIKVKAHIETLYGYSAHKDSDHLVEFVATASDRLKQVFVVMGEPKASMHLAQRLNDELVVKAAERDNAKQVNVGHVRKVEEQTLQQAGVKAERKKDELDEVDGKILELVKREGKAGLSSSKLYESLSKYGKDRSLRGRVDRLKKLGILITEDVQLKVGRSRVIRVKEQP
jgi:hypothetical protein